MQARVRFVRRPHDPLWNSRSCVSSARNAGESAICPVPAQPSAEIVRVECAKCRRECDLSGSGATLSKDRACRVREMQARVRSVRSARNPLHRSCLSSASARNATEINRECYLPALRATLCADRACRVREMEARVRFVRSARFWSWTQKWPVCSTNVVRERAFQSWSEKWPVCSTNVVRERLSEMDSEVASL